MEQKIMATKLRSLWLLMAGQRLRYTGAIAALGLGVALLYLSPLVVRAAIDGVIGSDADGEGARPVLRVLERLAGGENAVRTLGIAAAAVALLTALSGACMYLKGRWAAMASESIAKRLRENLYDHLQHLPAAYHDQAQTGDLVQRCTSDVDTLRLFYLNQVVEVARASILATSVLPILLLLDWRMALVAVAMLPVIVVFAVIFFSRIQGSFKAVDEAEGKLTATLQENLTGIRVVRAFARQDFERRKFAGSNRAHRDLHYRLYVLLAIYWASSDGLCFIQSGLVLFVGAWRVSHGHMSVGTLVAFLSYIALIIWPVRQMGRILAELGKAMVSLGRIQEILAQPRESAPPRDALRLPEPVKGEIVLRDVHFAHGQKPVLAGITLSIAAGETLAVLGPSGSGKSTLVSLLLRFYEYERGSITLDGLELRQLDRKQVRSQFAVVMQEPFLYSKTLRENIKLGRHAAEDSEAVEAATIACIHESIESFEQKYETLVGERGVTLSGGQRQRVAIARALLRDAPILVLDDALSAVDTRTETMIIDAMKRRRGRHTTIVIAHRLSTLMHADRIVVLDSGRIVQCGPHQQLAREQGVYQRLWQIQGALEEDLKREMADAEPAVGAVDGLDAAEARA